MREAFVFYKSFYEALKPMEAEQFKKITLAIAEYAFSGVEPVLNVMENSIFLLIKPQIDANNRKYENGKKGGSHGIKGGRPIVNNINPKETPTEPQENPILTPNVNANVNVNVNVKETVADADGKECGDHTSPPIDAFYIQEEAKKHGFPIETPQARDFIFSDLNNDWFTGEYNYISYAAERAKDSGKPHNEQICIFIKSWSYGFYKQNFPAWRAEKEAKKIRKITEAETEAAHNNPPKTCELCGGELLQGHNRLKCSNCDSCFDFNAEKLKWVIA